MTAILVPDAQTRAQLAAIRSLGRAGYSVHAAAASKDAMGLRSRFADRIAVHPRYDDESFCDWLDSYCTANGIAMIVPSGGLLGAVRHQFRRFAPLLPVSADVDAVYRGGDKIAAFECWQSSGLLQHHPQTTVVRRGVSFDPAVHSLPIYVKGGRGVDGEVVGIGFRACATHAAARDAVDAMLAAGYDAVLVQSGVSGRQVGVSLLMDNGVPLAANVVVDCHAEPHSKGTMSLRRTEWHQDVYEDAVARLRALDWRGCAMVEYRRDDATGEFNVIEVNARYWQYLHLDIHAGVDFPAIQARWFLTGDAGAVPRPKQGVVCRDTFPGEFAQVANAIKGRRKPVASVLGFILRFFDFRAYADLSFPGDRMIYWREFGRFLVSELRG